MGLDRFDLNLFVVFDAIYRERSVTRVAQQLHLTQPAVSNALNRLRQSFEDQLFVRTPEGMLPTPVADNLVGDVRRALALLNRSVLAGARFDPATSEKRYRLAMNDLAQALLLGGIYKTLRKQAPGVTLSCHYQDRQSATEELKAGALDLLIDTPQVNAKEFGQQTLLELPYAVACRRGHPLAKTSPTLEDYLQAEHLHVSSRKTGRGHADVALHARGEKRNTAVRIQSYLVASELVNHSDLLWTAPLWVIQKTGLHSFTAPFAIEPLQLQLFWNRNATDDPANRWLREIIRGIAIQ